MTSPNEWALQALQRAFNVGGRHCRRVHLEWFVCSPQCQDMASILTPALDYLEELTLFMAPACCESWRCLLYTPAPALRQLEISVRQDYFMRLPHELFGGFAPVLDAVRLHNVLLPEPPCAAFTAVKSLVYMSHDLLGTDDAEAIFVLCPCLEALSVGALLYDTGTISVLAARPTLRTLALQSIGNGFWADIVRHSLQNCQLRLLNCGSSWVDMLLLCKIEPIEEFHIVRHGDPRTQSWSVISSNAHDQSRAAEVYTLSVVSDLILQGCHNFRELVHLAIPEAFLVLTTGTGCIFDGLPLLTTLTVFLEYYPAPPLPCLFGTDNTPLRSTTLAVVRLATQIQYTEGYRAAHNIVRLAGELVGRWLPAGVNTLFLCGVVLDGGLDAHSCTVVSEWHRVARSTVPLHPWNWWALFPANALVFE